MDEKKGGQQAGSNDRRKFNADQQDKWRVKASTAWEQTQWAYVGNIDDCHQIGVQDVFDFMTTLAYKRKPYFGSEHHSSFAGYISVSWLV